MSPTVPRVPRRAGRAAAGSWWPEEAASGAGGSPDGDDSGPVVVLTGPWCLARAAAAEPEHSGATGSAAARYDAPTPSSRSKEVAVDDVLVVGEALIDIVRRADGRTAEHPGGSPANVALGLGRLGRVVSLLSRFGLDARGTSIAARLAASNVVVVPGSRTPAPTSTATAVLDEHGAAGYTFELDWQLPPAEELESPLTRARALHTGSIAAFLPPGGDAVLDLVRSASGRTTVSFDPNARPVLMGGPSAARERVEQFVRAADVVKVSDEDLDWLAPGEDPAAVAAAWLALGPSVVVVTRGGEGATGLAAAGRVDVQAPPVEVVDTVGAGDAFTAGLLDALAAADLLGAARAEELRAIDTGAFAAALRHAARVAAVTCSRPGADPPTSAELAAAYPEDATDGAA
jgi:fructokinase